MTDTALLVIDVQDSFRARPDSWAAMQPADIADRCSRLVADARSRGELVVWVLHAEPGSGGVFDPESGHVRLLEPLDPDAGEPLLHKTSHNAFTSTDLGQLLEERGITTVRVCGIRTEQCCETTARLASDLGFTVEFVVDATATDPLPRWDGSGTLSPAEVVERTASALQGRFARVVRLEEVLAR